MMQKGRSLRLFLVDGVPSGIITAEIMNWTGHVIVAPRSRLPDLIQRSEVGRTGIYFLVGTDPMGEYLPMLYIGETDNVGKRLAQHNKDTDKDFCERICFVTSKDQNLTKAHVRYLESRFLSISAASGRAKLVNGTAPVYGVLPEADIADMEFFIEQVRTILPVLGLDFLKEQPSTIAKMPASALAIPAAPESMVAVAPRLQIEESPVFELSSRKHGLTAEGREVDGEFVVLAGSMAKAGWVGVGHSYAQLYNSLIEQKILSEERDGVRLFLQDFSFRSPSAASAVVLGRQDNGRMSWRVKETGQTYAEWQDTRVSEVVAAAECV